MVWLTRHLLAALAVLAGLLFPAISVAQSSACTAGQEDTVTFNFSTARSTNAAGGTGTWTAASLGPASFGVGTTTGGGITANTITFAIDKDAAVAWTNAGAGANAPKLFTTGNLANTLLLSMNATAAGDQSGITLTFSRPMDKVRFFMGDVDDDAGSPWQDRLRIGGYLNGNATIAPTLNAATTVNYTIGTSGSFAEVTRNAGAGGCGNTDASCNVRIDFANPVDTIRINFIAGPGYPAPGQQYVGFQNFSYCVPRRDLSLSKVDTTPSFVAGATGTYTLTITNVGGTQTNTNYTVTDVISTQGVQFANPQAPGGGWTCTLSTTTLATDTATCGRATALGGNGATTTLTLTVTISADATASLIVNRAKVFGGGDPNKTTLTSTGAVANCNAASEGYDGGGSTYFSGGATNAGCAYEETTLTRQALLTVSKTNGTTTMFAGSTTTYTLTFVNSGPSAAPGTTVQDAVAAGLGCSTVTFTSTPVGSVTVNPTPLTLSALQSGSMSLTPTFPPNSTATFLVTCRVNATGS